MEQEVVEDILRFLQITLDPSTSQLQRSEYLEKLEFFKNTADLFTYAPYLIHSSSKLPLEARLYGCQLVKKLVENPISEVLYRMLLELVKTVRNFFYCRVLLNTQKKILL